MGVCRVSHAHCRAESRVPATPATQTWSLGAELKYRGSERSCRVRAYSTPLAEQKLERLPECASCLAVQKVGTCNVELKHRGADDLC